MARCYLCFKEKGQLQSPLPKFPAQVCKGCFYEVDRIVGFLSHYGFRIEGQLSLPESKKRHPSSKNTNAGLQTKSKPLKEKKNTIPLDNV